MSTQYYGYKHWTTEDVPRIFYVGKGKLKRPFEGAGARSKKWCAVTERYGLRVEVCIGPCTDAEAIAWEIATIANEDTYTTQYSTENGENIRCNFTHGGDGASGHRHTEEFKQKVRERLTGKRGVTHSDVAKLKMSLARKGVRKPLGFAEAVGQRSRKPIEQLDLSGNIIATFESNIAAARFSGQSPATISNHCRGKRKPQLWQFKLV